ncbi:MAG: helix-turn-helix domain-containing protein [Acholeplasma sp.]|nr:helix-turn-helix domain-containing protein [Acholeplasma sp.]
MTNKININDIASKYGTTFKFTQPSNIVNAQYVKELRSKLNYTQLYFSQVLGVTKKTIEKWEQGKNPVKGPSAALLYIINENPEILKLLVFDDSKYSKLDNVEEETSNFKLSTDQQNNQGGCTKTLKNVFCAA